MKAIGVDRAMVGLVKSMYNQTECSVTVNGNMTNWFKVHTGVRQGCLLSPCLFNLFLEFVMKDIWAGLHKAVIAITVIAITVIRNYDNQ